MYYYRGIYLCIIIEVRIYLRIIIEVYTYVLL